MKKRSSGDFEIEKALQPVLVRLRYQHFLNALGRGIAGGTVLTVLLLLLSHIYPLPDIYLWCISGCLAAVLIFLVTAFIFRPDFKTAARCADRRGLKERVTTALETKENNSQMAKIQRMDTLSHLQSYNAKFNFPIKFPFKEGRVCIISLLMIGVMLLLPNPMQAEVEKQAAVEKAIAEQVEKVQAVKKDVQDKQQELALQQREEAINTLDELEEELKETNTLGEALKSISTAEEKLDQLKSSEDYPGAEDINEMASALKSLELTEKLGDKISEGDVEASREETSELLERFKNEPGRQISDTGSRLQKEAGKMSDAGMKTALNSLGKAAQNGSPGGESGNNLADIMGKLSGQAGFYNDLNRTMAVLGDAKNAIAADSSGLPGSMAQTGSIKSGNPGSSTPAGKSGGSGSGDGEPGNGQSSGNSSNSSGSSSGSGAGMGTGGEGDSTNENSDSSFQPAGGEPAPMNYGEYEKVFVPRRVGQSGESSFVRGRAGDGPEEVIQTSDPAVMPGTLRPYREVVGDYSQAARESLNRTTIPAGMKDLVRDYFSTLEER